MVASKLSVVVGAFGSLGQDAVRIRTEESSEPLGLVLAPLPLLDPALALPAVRLSLKFVR